MVFFLFHVRIIRLSGNYVTNPFVFLNPPLETSHPVLLTQYRMKGVFYAGTYRADLEEMVLPMA